LIEQFLYSILVFDAHRTFTFKNTSLFIVSRFFSAEQVDNT